MIKLIEELCSVQGVSGYEERIGSFICSRISKYFDTCEKDRLGNIIAYKKGSAKNARKIAFVANMDQTGFLVTHIEKNGHIKFSPLGETDIFSVIHKELSFENGAVGIMMPESSDLKSPAYNSFYANVGTKTEEETKKLVSLGETFVIKSDVIRLGESKICANSLNNRVGCAILLCCAEKLKDNADDIYFIFSAQKNAGNRGIKPAAFAVSPDIAISIETSLSSHKDNSTKALELGVGVGLKIKDKSVICNELLTSFIRDLASEVDVKIQDEVLNFGNSELVVMQSSGVGVAVGGITIPCQNPTSCTQIMDISDIESALNLTARLLNTPFPKLN